MATENLIRASLISPHTDIMYVHMYVCAYMYVCMSGIMRAEIHSCK